jgi:predicted ester cyclase
MTADDPRKGAFGADDPLVDYILGITFEIWEEGQIDLIHQYYGAETTVFALDGITRGAGQMVDGTRAMLEAFPDRLLLGDDVIWSGNRADGYYSSHRITSPMTNMGASRYGPATGKKVQIMTIADCVVEEGVITREWLIRDNHALCAQLGFDALEAASVVAAERSDECLDWIASESDRVCEHGIAASGDTLAEKTMSALWGGGEKEFLIDTYSPYAVLHRSPVELYSGRTSLLGHYSDLRNGIAVRGVTVDHLASQRYGNNDHHVAVRWAVAGDHAGDLLGVAATGKPVFVMGSTHWRIVADRIALEWTIFDGMGVLAQIA